MCGGLEAGFILDRLADWNSIDNHCSLHLPCP